MVKLTSFPLGDEKGFSESLNTSRGLEETLVSLKRLCAKRVIEIVGPKLGVKRGPVREEVLVLSVADLDAKRDAILEQEEAIRRVFRKERFSACKGQPRFRVFTDKTARRPHINLVRWALQQAGHTFEAVRCIQLCSPALHHASGRTESTSAGNAGSSYSGPGISRDPPDPLGDYKAYVINPNLLHL
jgi:hypothetical protein